MNEDGTVHFTRAQVISLFNLAMALPLSTEFDRTDTDSYGTHLVRAQNEFGEKHFKLPRRGGHEEYTPYVKPKSPEKPAA